MRKRRACCLVHTHPGIIRATMNDDIDHASRNGEWIVSSYPGLRSVDAAYWLALYDRTATENRKYGIVFPTPQNNGENRLHPGNQSDRQAQRYDSGASGMLTARSFELAGRKGLVAIHRA